MTAAPIVERVAVDRAGLHIDVVVSVTCPPEYRPQIEAMTKLFRDRLEEATNDRLRSAQRRRRTREPFRHKLRAVPPDAIVGPIVVDAPPIVGGLGDLAPGAWPVVTLLPTDPFLLADVEELVRVALDRHWGNLPKALTWLQTQFEAHPEAGRIYGWQALFAALEREATKQGRKWSVETADLTPAQRACHAETAAAMMRWRLEHAPGVALQDATRANLLEEASQQFETARRAIERVKWLKAIAAQLPSDDAVVKEHLTADEVLGLRQAAVVTARPLSVARRSA